MATRFLTVREVAARLAISTATVYALCERGQLRHIRVSKGGHADVIPIAAELVRYLEWALATSPSELVFPAADGSMMRADCDLEKVLRRAMARAGIVTGYNHVCRRPGCGHSEMAPDADLRRCPRIRRNSGRSRRSGRCDSTIVATPPDRF